MHQWPGAIILVVGKVYRYASICYYNIELSVILAGILFFPFSRSSYSQDEITPPDKWEILPEQIEFEEELGRGEFGVVHKAIFRKGDEMEGLVTKTSKWPVSTRKPKAPQLVAVKVLHGKKY